MRRWLIFTFMGLGLHPAYAFMVPRIIGWIAATALVAAALWVALT